MRLAAGADGTFWAVGDCGDGSGPEPSRQAGGLNWFDEAGWAEWTWHNLGLQPVLQGMTAEPFEVAPDGSLWVGWPLWRTTEEGRWSDTRDDWGGVRRFDGSAWDHYLAGISVESADIAADGSVWALVSEWWSDDAEPGHVYVITPEAAALTE